MLDYKTILQTQLNQILIDLNLTAYSCVVEDEQIYLTNSDSATFKLEPKTIYITIKELGGATVYNTSTIPVMLKCISEQNSVAVTKQVLDYFVIHYNLYTYTSGFNTIKYLLDTPESASNFDVIGYGFRSLYQISATFIISQNVIDMTSSKIDGNAVNIVSLSYSGVNEVDTQAFSGTPIASSVNRFSVNAMTIVVPMQMCDLLDKAIDIFNGDLSLNNIFAIDITLTHNKHITGNYHIRNLSLGILVGELPACSLEFVR